MNAAFHRPAEQGAGASWGAQSHGRRSFRWGVLGAALLLVGCGDEGPRGSALEPGVGPEREDSAVVDNKRVRRADNAAEPERLDAASSTPGVRLGFADASGGKSLTQDVAQHGEQASDVAGQDDLQTRILGGLRDAESLGLNVADLENIDVRVEGQRVTLTGTVPHRQAAQAIEQRVQSVQGVASVDNRLEISGAETQLAE